MLDLGRRSLLLSLLTLTACHEAAAPELLPTGTGGATGSGGGAAGAGGNPPSVVCDAPEADCNGQADDGCETSLESDWRHCGACGHDCLGGECVAGKCTPDLVAHAAGMLGFALDDTHLYVAHADPNEQMKSVLTRMKHDGSDVQPMHKNPNTSYNIWVAVDDERVYWADIQRSLRSMPKSATGGAGVTEIAVAHWVLLDDTHIYWCAGVDGSIVRRPKGGGDDEILSGPAATNEFPFWMTLDDDHLYWTTGGIPGDKVGQVMRLPKTGGDPEILATGQDSPAAVAVDTTHVYWTNAVFSPTYEVIQEGSVRKLAKDQPGGAVVDLATGLGMPRGMAVDDRHIYWAESQPGRVWRATLSGTDAVVVADGFDSLCEGEPPTCITFDQFGELALTGDALYWNAWNGSSFAAGGIWRLAK